MQFCSHVGGSSRRSTADAVSVTTAVCIESRLKGAGQSSGFN